MSYLLFSSSPSSSSRLLLDPNQPPELRTGDQPPIQGNLLSDSPMEPAHEKGRGNVDLQERLMSLLLQLRTESGILDRVVHKGKNQHRRCHYFKSLLKVRRDVRLLLSAEVEEILSSLFKITNTTRHGQQIHLLEELKKKGPDGSHSSHERLLGIARLLSQMTEPVLTAAIQISSLLARSFFMGYSLLIFSLLARLRVLLQQMLLDFVAVYNLVSDLSQKRQSAKVAKNGVEVIREYHPPHGEILTLECLWEVDKFVLHERIHQGKTQNENILEAISLEMPTIHYETIEVSEEGLESNSEQTHKAEAPLIPLDAVDHFTNRDDVRREPNYDEEEHLVKDKNPSENLTPNTDLDASVDSFLNSETPRRRIDSGKRVAFIPVRKTSPSDTDENRLNKKPKLSQLADIGSSENDESEDPFFSLLTSGGMKGKLF